jgi:hypothetical protein
VRGIAQIQTDVCKFGQISFQKKTPAEPEGSTGAIRASPAMRDQRLLMINYCDAV